MNSFQSKDRMDGENRTGWIMRKETEWIMTADDWRDMIYHGFIFSFPSLVLRSTKATIHIQINDEERRMYPLRFSTIAYLEMKPVRRAQSEGKRVFTSLNDIV
ncbi:hypothetical protein TNCT_223071 [Trichonephila clavata]|uniref:Uncharacterized protein n=1 Tax=Trichonephila clavata TaxID=2740835 RepID=A0A8X6HT62_TRICU|nr:hypothetical protein TNCT_223071 [Trichonephila clavata]